MVYLTQSMKVFLTKKGLLKEMSLLVFGHLEVFTPEMQKEYREWLQTEEGQSYLRGGENYDAEYGGKLDEIADGGADAFF